MLPNLEVEYFHPSDPFPEEWVLPISIGENDLLNKTLGWMTEQSSGAILFPSKIKPDSVKTWLEDRKKNSRHYIVASLRDGRKLLPVGFVELSFRLTRLHSYTTEVIPNGFPAVAYVDTMYVLPDYRGKGVASALMEETETIARKNKCKMITLFYNTRNNEASKFYYRKKYLHLETQLYGTPGKPKSVANILAQTISFENLKKNKAITYELKNHVSRDSKSFYPLFSEVDIAVRNIQNNNANVGIQFNGGRDGFALIKPILGGRIVSVYPLLFIPQIWTDPTKLKKYMFFIRQLCDAKYGTSMLHTCTMDLGRVRYLETVGFVPVNEVLRKQL